MFIAKFQEVDNSTDKFSSDRNGNLPFIGTVIAGKSIGSLINGTMFQREGLIPNKLYLCENEDAMVDGELLLDPNGKPYQNCVVISEVPLLELPALRTMLGKPVDATRAKATEVPAEEVGTEA